VTAHDGDLRVGVSALRRHPGERVRVLRDVDLAGIEVSTAEVPVDRRCRLDVVLESLSDGVTLIGTLEVPWHGPCRRCLEDTEGTTVVDLREVFSDKAARSDPAASSDPTAAGTGDLLPIDGDVVDLTPIVHDAAVLALPIAPLCRADCPGPDPEHFPVITGVDEERPVDPRWSALDELRFDQGPDDRLE